METPHWATDIESQQRFTQAVKERGIRLPDILKALNISANISEYEGTLDEAIAEMEQYVKNLRQDAAKIIKPNPARHSEAQVIAFTDVYLPNGAKVSVTARHGANGETVAATVLALVEALEILEEHGIKTRR